MPHMAIATARSLGSELSGLPGTQSASDPSTVEDIRSRDEGSMQHKAKASIAPSFNMILGTSRCERRFFAGNFATEFPVHRLPCDVFWDPKEVKTSCLC